MSYSRRRLLQCSIIITWIIVLPNNQRHLWRNAFGISAWNNRNARFRATVRSGSRSTALQNTVSSAEQCLMHNRSRQNPRPEMPALQSVFWTDWNWRVRNCEAGLSVFPPGQYLVLPVSTGSCEFEAVLPSFVFILTWSSITQYPLTKEQR